MSMSDHVAGEEPWLPVEEVASRLGLPLSVLLHRVEAGDIPARRVESEEGVQYALRLGDLGIELDDTGMHASAIDGDESSMSATFEPPVGDDEDTSVVFEPSDATGVHSAIASAFDSGPEQVPAARTETATATAWVRPREPQQPPPWIIHEHETLDRNRPADPEPAADTELEVELPGAVAREPTPAVDDVVPLSAAAAASSAGDDTDADAASVAGAEADADEVDADEVDADEVELLDEDSIVAEIAVPPPSARPVGLLDAGSRSPRGDLAAMSLDARELVAGLLDRWERTLEQRIYTEQRQRFQAELVARQNVVKELQMELHATRAEHAAAQAEKDRLLAAKERELADRERDLAETRRRVDEIQQQAATRRRRWFRSRDD
jgi:hypothetical protein